MILLQARRDAGSLTAMMAAITVAGRLQSVQGSTKRNKDKASQHEGPEDGVSSAAEHARGKDGATGAPAARTGAQGWPSHPVLLFRLATAEIAAGKTVETESRGRERELLTIARQVGARFLGRCRPAGGTASYR